MKTTVDKQLKKQVFKQIQVCLATLVGGSGHLSSYSMRFDTFEITNMESNEAGLTKFFFEADAYRESEFTVYDDNHQPDTQHIAGNITLDRRLGLVKDKTGRIMLEPWDCVDQTTKRQL